MKTHIYHLATINYSSDNKIPSTVTILATRQTPRRLSEREIESFKSRQPAAEVIKEIRGAFFLASVENRDYYHQIFGGWGAEPIITRIAA